MSARVWNWEWSASPRRAADLASSPLCPHECGEGVVLWWKHIVEQPRTKSQARYAISKRKQCVHFMFVRIEICKVLLYKCIYIHMYVCMYVCIYIYTCVGVYLNSSLCIFEV